MATPKWFLTLLLGAQLAASRDMVGLPDGAIVPASWLHETLQMQGELGAVASENEACTEIGTALLKKGGNAADAMVGTAFCVGVVAMHHSGIGGGGFMVVRSADGEYEHIDFRETAPMAAYKDMFYGNNKGSITGGLAVGVPGEVRGLEHLHHKYGKLSWKSVMQPAIELARTGFQVSEDLVKAMDEAKTDYGGCGFLCRKPEWARDFVTSEGYRVQLADWMTRHRYANTLEQIAKGGSEAFYSGPIAQSIVDVVRKEKGTMTLEDMDQYKVVSRPTLNITYRDYRLVSGGAPSGGSVLLSIMKILEGFDDVGEADKVNITTHRFAEAMRFGFSERTKLGDPAFVPGVEKYEHKMLRNTTARLLRDRISDKTTFDVPYYNRERTSVLSDHGTSHIVAADKSGLAISLTTTISHHWGSKIMVPETGIVLNNEMNDFSIPYRHNKFGYPPAAANYIFRGKRPLSSIAPVIVENLKDNSLAMVIGAAGGSWIITSVAQCLWHILDHGKSLKEALGEKRFHNQLIPDTMFLEYGFNETTRDFLMHKGHNISIVEDLVSAVHAISLDEEGTFVAQGEPRQKKAAGRGASEHAGRGYYILGPDGPKPYRGVSPTG